MTKGKHEPYSLDAKLCLEQLLSSAHNIHLEYETANLKDKYNRQLAYVFADEQLVQNTLVQKGYAKVKYIHTHHERYLPQLLLSQKKAQQSHLGIWH